MSTHRLGRINEDIQRVLSSLLRTIKDPRVNQGMISVTAVDTTGDLRYSKIYLSVMGLRSEKELLKASARRPATFGMSWGKRCRYATRRNSFSNWTSPSSAEQRSAGLLTTWKPPRKREPMKTDMTIRETADWLKARDNFLVLTHLRPDGDTLGCAAGLVQGLGRAGKTAYILFNPEATPRYTTYVEKHWAPDGFEPSYIISVDTASQGVFQVNAKDYLDRVTLCIDHHPSNAGYAEHRCLDASKASCGEIIYEILLAMGIIIDAEAATSLYVRSRQTRAAFSLPTRPPTRCAWRPPLSTPARRSVNSTGSCSERKPKAASCSRL
jgi:ribosome-binding factor A